MKKEPYHFESHLKLVSFEASVLAHILSFSVVEVYSSPMGAALRHGAEKNRWIVTELVIPKLERTGFFKKCISILKTLVEIDVI